LPSAPLDPWTSPTTQKPGHQEPIRTTPPLVNLELAGWAAIGGWCATTGAQPRGQDDAGLDDYDLLSATKATQPKKQSYCEASDDSGDSARLWSNVRSRRRRRTSGYGSVGVNRDDRNVTKRQQCNSLRTFVELSSDDDSDQGND